MGTLPRLHEILSHEIDYANYAIEISISTQSQFTYVFGGHILNEIGVPQISLNNKSISQILQTNKGIKIVINNDTYIDNDKLTPQKKYFYASSVPSCESFSNSTASSSCTGLTTSSSLSFNSISLFSFPLEAISV